MSVDMLGSETSRRVGVIIFVWFDFMWQNTLRAVGGEGEEQKKARLPTVEVQEDN